MKDSAMDPNAELLAARKAVDTAALVAAATASVKQRPLDAAARLALVEALIRTGALERADNHLDILSGQDPAWAVRATMLRHLVRAEQTRLDVMAGRAVPELVQEPCAVIRDSLARLVAINADDSSASASEQETRLLVNGSLTSLRDADDRFADIIEIYSAGGRYFWVPMSAVVHMELHKPESLFDTLWRPCMIELADGPDGAVFWPQLYPARPEDEDAHRLGQATDWLETGNLVIGQGRRCLLVGDDLADVSSITSIAQQASPAP
jgi:type VI secretion system protein ImpE